MNLIIISHPGESIKPIHHYQEKRGFLMMGGLPTQIAEPCLGLSADRGCLAPQNCASLCLRQNTPANAVEAFIWCIYPYNAQCNNYVSFISG
jgi:hypothetical protein